MLTSERLGAASRHSRARWLLPLGRQRAPFSSASAATLARQSGLPKGAIAQGALVAGLEAGGPPPAVTGRHTSRWHSSSSTMADGWARRILGLDRTAEVTRAAAAAPGSMAVGFPTGAWQQRG